MATGDALGIGIVTDYVSQRTGVPGTSGWATHALSPSREPLSNLAAFLAKDLKYFGDFSDDFSRALLRSFTPLTNAPKVAAVANLYMRTDALSPGQGSYQLLSDCAACAAPLSVPSGRYNPYLAASTPDLGHVIFDGTQNLLPGLPAQPAGCAASGDCNPRLYEWDNGTLRLAGVLPNGSPAPRSIAGNGAQLHYTMHTISVDGSRIFFTVASTPLGATGALYMRLDHASTVQLNASERTDCADNGLCTGAPAPDPGGPRAAGFQTASTDGSKAFFTSDEQLTDAPGGGLYMYDTTLPGSDPHNLTLIGTATGVAATSDDGSYVYFITNGVFPGQPPHPPGTTFGLYVWHNGTVTSIGSLVDPGSALGTNLLGPTTLWVLAPYAARTTPDGTSLLFMSDSGIGLTGYDHASHCPTGQGCTEVYLYHATTNTLTCVSCNPDGAPATAPATYIARTGTSASGSDSTRVNHPITDDGSRVFFETGERLLPNQDRNSKSDVYQYDVPTGQLHLLSSGTGDSDAHFLEASRDGSNVLFTTRDRLVGWDTDGSIDLYDARVGGGFPDPPAVKPECTGDSCQGAVTAVPGAALPATAGAVADSNNVQHHSHPAKHCAHGKIKRHVHGKSRCVKRHRTKRR